MSDQIIDRRKKKERRSGEDRRKCPRRMGEVYPPPNSDEWKKIVKGKIKDFMDMHMMTISELKLLLEEIDDG